MAVSFASTGSVAVALAGIPGGLAMFGTIPADLVNYFAHVLRIEQKLAYIYGWPSFLADDDEIDDETRKSRLCPIDGKELALKTSVV